MMAIIVYCSMRVQLMVIIVDCSMHSPVWVSVNRDPLPKRKEGSSRYTNFSHPNAFSKATPTTFIDGMADIESSKACFTCCNCQCLPLSTTSLPHEVKTKQQLMIVRIPALATYAVPSGPNGPSVPMVPASQWSQCPNGPSVPTHSNK